MALVTPSAAGSAERSWATFLPHFAIADRRLGFTLSVFGPVYAPGVPLRNHFRERLRDVAAERAVRAQESSPAASDPIVMYELAPFETIAWADVVAAMAVSGLGSLEVLLLGTFHFADAGLDSFKPEVQVDFMEPSRQRNGIDGVTAWYNRNLRIFGNLQRLAEPGDRLLVLIGSGRVPVLRHAVEASPEFRFIEVRDVIGATSCCWPARRFFEDGAEQTCAAALMIVTWIVLGRSRRELEGAEAALILHSRRSRPATMAGITLPEVMSS